MATVVSKSTFRVLRSVNTTDYPPSEWWINPDLPAAPDYYWKAGADGPVEMDAGERAAVDLSRLATRKVDRSAEIAAYAASLFSERYPEFRQQKYAIMLTQAYADGLTNRVNYIRQLGAWSDEAMTAAFTAEQQIAACATIEQVNAIELDESWLANDPGVSLMVAAQIMD